MIFNLTFSLILSVLLIGEEYNSTDTITVYEEFVNSKNIDIQQIHCQIKCSLDGSTIPNL